MKATITILILIIHSLSGFSQHKKAYSIFTNTGGESDYFSMIEGMDGADIILFGELHNNAISHWLQLETTIDLATQKNITLGAEMFEADNQAPLNSYLRKEIDQKGLDSLARLWSNYKTDYAPLLNFARENNLDFIATNIPRKYANQVYKKGFGVLDTLSPTEKQWIAPLPIAFDPELPTYRNILTMTGDHGTPKLVMAQAIKDATMAHFILENKIEDTPFLHYNGSYHSDYYEGIMWYLKKQQPTLKYVTISTVIQKDISQLEEDNLGKADFIIVVDENVTSTY